MKIALVQMNSTMGHFDGTRERVLAHDRAFARQGAELAVYPSTVVTGYDPQALLTEPGFQADIATMLEQLANECTVPTLLPFTFELAGEPVFEVAYLSEGSVVPLRMASILASLGSLGTAPVGDAPIQFSLGDVDFGIAFDLTMLDAYASGSQNADVVIYLPFDGYNTDDEASAMAHGVGDGFYLKEAAEANAWLVAVNGVGAQDQIVFSGSSFVLAPWGELACVLPAFEEVARVVDVDPLSEGPLRSPLAPPVYNRTQFLWSALTLATHDFAVKQGMGGVGVLMTGDLMSSAAAALAVDALGPTRVHGVVAPVLGAKEAADAKRLAQNLRIQVTEIAGEELDAAANALGLTYQAAALSLARIRANVLFRAKGYLSLSGVDKTALAVGQDFDAYASCDFAPFSDVYRTDLLALVSNRNLKSPVVPRTVLSRVEVPRNLRLETRLRSDALILSDLDSILLRRVERGETLSELVRDGCDEMLAQFIVGRYDASELARRSCPVGPVVSDRSLLENRLPICCAWHDHVREDVVASDSSEPAALYGLDELMERFAQVTGTAPGATEPAVGGQTDIPGFLRDFASAGGFSAEGDDVWGSGLFSKN